MHENLYESNRNYGELCTKTYMKAIETMVKYYGELLCTKTYMKAIETMVNYARKHLYESNRNLWRIMHENLYKSNRNYDELRTKTYMEAIETMVNYARKPI